MGSIYVLLGGKSPRLNAEWRGGGRKRRQGQEYLSITEKQGYYTMVQGAADSLAC